MVCPRINKVVYDTEVVPSSCVQGKERVLHCKYCSTALWLCEAIYEQKIRQASRTDQDMYLLTTCASCAAPLDSKGAKQCSRCKTRYCSATCQREHWARGGHDSLCKKIKKGGGAEEYHADRSYVRARRAAIKA